MKTMLAALVLLSASTVPSFAADAGKAAYDKSCKSCHGATGTPNPAIAKMMKVEMKDLGSADVQSMTDADLKKVITEGKGKMKPVTAVSGPAADQLIAYIRTCKK